MRRNFPLLLVRIITGVVFLAEGILKFTRAQTVAVQRLLPISPSQGMDAALHARWMTRLLSLVRWTRIFG